ncbi:hypothetical protein DMUE_1496 [Dictyocoela muelleri]|nr:hypothetical protein DMUE_1496 [Dictyocoela muelleri]
MRIDEATKKMAILVDGTTIETSNETNLELYLQGDKTTQYKVKAIVLKNMSIPEILLIDFFLSYLAKIALLVGTISLDNKYYELNLGNQLMKFENKLINKTRINANITSDLKSQDMEK